MSLRNVQGVVVRTNERHVNTQRGAATAHSVLVNTGAEEEWFSFGFRKTNLQSNQQVRFVAKEQNGFWNGDVKTIEIDKNVPPTEGSPTPSKTMAAAVQNADQRQRSIVWQSSCKTAANIAHSVVELEYVALPAKTKAADKYDFYLNLVNEIAMRLYTSGLNPPEPLTLLSEEELADMDDSSGDEEYKVL